jgi:cell division GTPase FtsZ
VKILLASTGGGGGNILRSIKALFRQDLALAQKTDARYADRLRRALTTRFLDTNEFSLADVPAEERLLIGAQKTRRLGSRHNPDVAREALEESRSEVTALFRNYSVIVLIGTGGKGTGAGTMFPLAQIAREQRKLVIPIFVRPSFEWHEVDKRRYDHALHVIDQFDSARMRLIEILNDRGYTQASPASQAVVWERMNVPIARGLRGLIYVLSDLSQVDPSDLCSLAAGPGRFRIGFGELDPAAGADPSDAQIDEASAHCWDNGYYAFTRPVGTTLVCIQGDWSNIADGKIKRRLGTLATADVEESLYNPLYARPSHAPRPWGVTALFAEHTGIHDPLEVDWPLDSRVSLPPPVQAVARERVAASEETQVAAGESAPMDVVVTVEPPPAPASFQTFRELCLGVNRGDAAALAIAGNGVTSEIPLDYAEVRKLLNTVWFRSVFTQLSEDWRSRLLDTLLQTPPIPDHMIRVGRHNVHASESSYEELKRVVTETVLPDAVRADLQLLVGVGMLWGPEVMKRFEFAPNPSRESSSRLFSLAAFNPEQ